MDNMISVINDNLKNVVNGIRTHKGEISNALAKVKADMADKSEAAERLKSEVEESKNTISSLEEEISTLENDLDELTVKFGDSFKETVAAGNKEINSKIIKDRAAISAESTKIEELTTRAKFIKDELLNLKDKKEALEINLEDTSILESYYNKRINAIIDYSIQHTSELDKFQDEDVNLDLVTSLNALTDKDFENNVDDNVFSEIADISDSDLVDIEEDYDFSSIASDDFDNEAFSVTKQLDSVIEDAKSLTQEMEEKSEDLIPEEVVEDELVESELANDEEDDTSIESEDDAQEEVEEEIDSTSGEELSVPFDFDFEEDVLDFNFEEEETKTNEEVESKEDADETKEEINEEDIIDPDNEFVVPFDFTQIKPIEKEIDIDVEEDLENEELDKSKFVGEPEDDFFVPEAVSAEDKEAIDNILVSVNELIDEKEEVKEPDTELEVRIEDEPEEYTNIDLDDNEDIDINAVQEFDPLAPIEFNTDEIKVDEVEEPSNVSEINIVNEDDIDLDEMPVYEGSNNNDYYDETTRELADLVKGIQENENSYNNDNIPEINDVITDTSITSNEDNIYGVIQKNGLFANSFNSNDLEMMDATVNANDFEELIKVLDKHSIDRKVLYKSAKVIEMNNPSLVDRILTNLEETDATSLDIETIFASIEKVNGEDLERAVKDDETADLTTLLFKTMPTNNEDVISSLLDLSKGEYRKLKNNTTEEELNKINMFASLVLTNVNTLKDKGVDKPIECFVEHPKRFLYNPSRLNDIFDKYDDADLVRCINKNSAVIDKL